MLHGKSCRTTFEHRRAPIFTHFLQGLVNSDSTNQHQYVKFFCPLNRTLHQKEECPAGRPGTFFIRLQLNVCRLRRPGALEHSLELKEIHIHVIFTFRKKSLKFVAEENFSPLIPDIICFIDFIFHCRTCSWFVFSYNRKILAT